MITINNISMGFTKRTLFKDVTLSIFPKEKIGLTGPNGSGKTTLFSIILGETEPIAGNVQIQKNINIGYLAQETKFHSNKTVMEELTEGDDRIRSLMDEKRSLEDTHKADAERYGDIMHELEQFGIYDLEHKAEKILMGLGFKSSDFHRPISELSGGWQMRTQLAKMLTYPFDLLLLQIIFQSTGINLYFSLTHINHAISNFFNKEKIVANKAYRAFIFFKCLR